MDNLTKEQRHKNMCHIRSKNTKPEIRLRHALWKRGIRYRKNDGRLFGRPDIVIEKYRIAVFVDGDFFHGRNDAVLQRIQTHKEYWVRKIKNNKARDLEVNEALTEQGWLVLRFWASDIMKNLQQCIDKILRYTDKGIV